MVTPEARAVRMPPGATARAPRAAGDARPAADARSVADARPGGRSHPPVPVPPRPPVPAAAPRTSMAPFAAVPAPERPQARPSATALDERPISVSLPPLPPLDPPAAAKTPALPVQGMPAGHPSLPVTDLPSTGWTDDEHGAPWATGRGALRAPRAVSRPAGPPLVERRSSRLPAGGIRPSTGPGESPVYGDWTKPSIAGRAGVPAEAPALPPLVPPAPPTSAIPDREVAGRRNAEVDDEFDSGADLPITPRQAGSPGTGPVGGRAAFRAERQAAEAARRKAAKRSGRPLPSALDEEDDEGRRPRRALKSLVAVAVVALGVLGVYTVTSPDTQETAARTPAPVTSAAPTAAATTPALPPLEAPDPPVVEQQPATPVRVPVTVLNATDVDGLAASIASTIAAEGWETPTPAGYPNGDIAATTVYFTEDDEKQRQAAIQLVDMFPELQGPAVRFFEVPADVTAPGLVVVAAGDWQP